MTEEKKRTTTRQTGTTIIHKLKGKKVIYAWYPGASPLSALWKAIIPKKSLSGLPKGRF
ncbi:MAG: hypothetical protein LUQ44_04385 [Methanothrix sp.]|jgi:hypothetical protein|nr:hypothetical protein [Methanothrix sp.]